MKKWTKILIDAYFYSIMFASTLCFAVALGVARLNNWEVLFVFNDYGEGMLEYTVMAFWFVVLIIKLIEWNKRYEIIKV